MPRFFYFKELYNPHNLDKKNGPNLPKYHRLIAL